MKTDDFVEKNKSQKFIVDLLNDLELPSTSNYDYSDLKGVQKLTVKTKNNLSVVEITLPDQLFEWFVDVKNLNNQSIIKTWVDHYGDTFDKLQKEMKEEIQNFIDKVATFETRIVELPKAKKIFQYFNGNSWSIFEIF